MIELSDQEQIYVERILADFNVAEKEHVAYEQHWNRFHGLYHLYRDWAADRNFGLPPDADTRHFTQIAREWGAMLRIPLIFGLIETIVPRLVAADPRMTLLPPKRGREADVESVKVLLERQQSQMDYRLKLQDVGKSGLMYGLGVMKTYWRKEYRMRRELQKATLPEEGNEWMQTQPASQLVYDDPDCEAVDIWDFFWDPFGHDMRTVRYVIHRTWRSKQYCLDMAQSGRWRADLSAEDLQGAPDKYTQAWADRMVRQGFGQRDVASGDIQEVWEYHDGQKVCTLVNRSIPVQEGGNPNWHGEMPFQIYRPTSNLHQFVGKGEIEPVQDLSAEMDTLRTQRRDAATFALQRPYAFTEGLVDPADLKVGPGIAIPVNGNPKDLLFPLPIEDLPASAYQESAEIKNDFDYTSGISDPVVGANSGQGTATEAQMVFQAASERIKLKTKRLALEVVKPGAKQILSMDQQRILTNREIPVPKPPEPGQAEQRWAWYEVGPEQLQGEWALEPEDGSMSPENVAQERADGAQIWAALSQSPNVDQRRLVEVFARKHDIDAEALMAPEEPRVPAVILDLLVEAGIPDNLISRAWEAAQQAEATGERPDWPPDDVMQAQEQVQQDEMDQAVDEHPDVQAARDATQQMEIDRQVQKQTQGQPAASSNGGGGSSSGSSNGGGSGSTEMVPYQPQAPMPAPDNTDVVAAISELAAAISQQPPPNINVEGPIINVDVKPGEPPIVNVDQPEQQKQSGFDVVEDGKVVRSYQPQG